MAGALGFTHLPRLYWPILMLTPLAYMGLTQITKVWLLVDINGLLPLNRSFSAASMQRKALVTPPRLDPICPVAGLANKHCDPSRRSNLLGVPAIYVLWKWWSEVRHVNAGANDRDRRAHHHGANS
jgi:hypothetical protein